MNAEPIRKEDWVCEVCEKSPCDCDWHKTDALPDVDLGEPKPPVWEIRVHLSTTGVIMNTFVNHRGKQVAGKICWTDRTTLLDVVTWANRATACDAGLTASHLRLL